MRTKEEQIQWTIDKWGLKEDMNGALKDGLAELWNIAQNQVNKNHVPDVIKSACDHIRELDGMKCTSGRCSKCGEIV